MLEYFIKTLQYLKRVEPHLNERRFLASIGMNQAQINKVMEAYNNANIRVQEL